MPEEVLVISLGNSSQTMPGMMPENEVTNQLYAFFIIFLFALFLNLVSCVIVNKFYILSSMFYF